MHSKLVDAANTFQDRRAEPVVFDTDRALTPLTGEQIVTYSGFISEIGKTLLAIHEVRLRLGLGNN